VNKSNAKFGAARQTKSCERGFSMIELMVVIMIILIVSAIAIISVTPGMQEAQVDAEMRSVIATVRQAREFAIANRRYVQISFPANNQIAVTEMNTLTPGAGVVNPVLTTLTLTPQFVFNLDGMPDTPDAFGNAGPIVFEGIVNGPVGGMVFQSDGELLDGGTFLPINGSIFMGYPALPSTARAVTVLGTTGRVRAWKSNGSLGWYQF